MLITKLLLTNFRAYTQAEFEFKEGMNLLVGTNGVGKTTVLEALRVCLSIILPNITKTKQKKENFTDTDIKIGEEYLQVVCTFIYLRTEYELLIVKYRENTLRLENKLDSDSIEVKDKEMFTPTIEPLKRVYTAGVTPIGVFFSTKRSLITEKAVTTAARGEAAAYVEGLSENRAFNLKIFSDWYKAQVELAKEDPSLLYSINTLNRAVETFLPQFKNLRVVRVNNKTRFIIDKNNLPLSLHQLSDGEKVLY